MAFTTGTAANQNDFLTKLRAYLITQGWTSLQYTAGVAATDISTAVLRAPGAIVGGEFFLYLTTANNAGANAFGIQIRGATGYDPAIDLLSQMGISPPTWLNLWQNAMPYWIYANDRHVKVAVKVNVSYMSAYAGLFLPYALPSEYPRPFFIAASYPLLASHSIAETRNRFIADPGIDCAFYLNRAGVWVPCGNQRTGTEAFYPENTPASFIYPHRGLFTNQLTTGFSDSESWSVSGLLSMRPNLSGNMPMFLCQLISVQELAMLGALDGVYAVPGFGRTSEQVLTFAGRNFRCFQNTFRSTARDFMSFEEA